MSDEQIAGLYKDYDAARRALGEIETSSRDARRDYAARHGLLAFPTIEAMRRGLASTNQLAA